jgi:hypothetical protein
VRYAAFNTAVIVFASKLGYGRVGSHFSGVDIFARQSGRRDFTPDNLHTVDRYQSIPTPERV